MTHGRSFAARIGHPEITSVVSKLSAVPWRSPYTNNGCGRFIEFNEGKTTNFTQQRLFRHESCLTLMYFQRHVRSRRAQHLLPIPAAY